MAIAWAPDLEDVADYVTSRTVDSSTPGSDEPLGTFSPDTYPTDIQVGRLIAGATQWVVNVTGDIVESLRDTAKDVAAMRAAALVEISYPVRDDDIEVANTLLEQARAARDELVAANRSAGGPGVSGTAAPVGSFPDARAWVGDHPAWP